MVQKEQTLFKNVVTKRFLNKAAKGNGMVAKGIFTKERVTTENSNEARDFYNQSRFGALLEDGRVQLGLAEALYLVEKKKLVVLDGKNKQISAEALLKRAQKADKNFWTRYCVFKDIRNRGYIIKTALKFGADFRIYDRGVKPGDAHARWIVYPVHEKQTLTWHEFAAKNRVAHSTKKKLLIAVVDEEGDCSYWESCWLRP
jgi:tRNA-intron endonuclease